MDVLRAALEAVDPYKAVVRSLEKRPLAPYGRRVFVVGAGKAGAAMARGAEEVLGENIAGGLVVVKDGHLDTGGAPLSGVRLAEASHPVPDLRGVGHTAKILEIVDRAGDGDLVLCLISGGGSALLTSPAQGVPLEDVQEITGLLLRAGATINELNAVRKHLSQVSGGQLVRRAAPARVVALILSDVTGSPLDVIASGPTVPDPTTYSDAWGVVERYGLVDSLPASVSQRLVRGVRGEILATLYSSASRTVW
jgi:hydroxypyruvate reductase